MTIKFKNVYVNNASLVAGHLEKSGKQSKYYDKTYDNYYMDKKSFESSEVKLQKDALDILLKKTKKKIADIDLLVGGDLLNQISATSYNARDYNISYLGVFSACATSMESIIIASTFIDSKKINNAICITSSHNLAAEKQFRNPVEYGCPRPLSQTFTSTGGAGILLSSDVSNVRVSSATIGKVIDMKIKDANNMGAVMAASAADTIYRHLKDNNEKIEDYDLILTGDLGIYGKQILIDYMKTVYNIDMKKNYDDCGTLVYDMQKQKEITAGGSGPVCSCLINYGYVLDKLKHKKLKKVLLVTTGALFSPTFLYQKNTIPGISHAVCLEAI